VQSRFLFDWPKDTKIKFNVTQPISGHVDPSQWSFQNEEGHRWRNIQDKTTEVDCFPPGCCEIPWKQRRKNCLLQGAPCQKDAGKVAPTSRPLQSAKVPDLPPWDAHPPPPFSPAEADPQDVHPSAKTARTEEDQFFRGGFRLLLDAGVRVSNLGRKFALEPKPHWWRVGEEEQIALPTAEGVQDMRYSGSKDPTYRQTPAILDYRGVLKGPTRGSKEHEEVQTEIRGQLRQQLAQDFWAKPEQGVH